MVTDLYIVGFDLSEQDDMTASIGILGTGVMNVEIKKTIHGEKAIELYEKLKGEINNE
jgi:hypothetical protein